LTTSPILPEFLVNEQNELNITEFVDGLDVIPIGVAQLASNKSALYTVEPIDKDNEMFNKRQELIYFLTFNGRIVKIGGTSTGFKSRIGSYYCGTRANRERGTCSTTNYHVSEAIYAALVENKEVRFYAYFVPPVTKIVDVLGMKKEIPCLTWQAYEDRFLSIYKDTNHTYPPLSKNTSK
jgi:hypothetical protein